MTNPNQYRYFGFSLKDTPRQAAVSSKSVSPVPSFEDGTPSISAPGAFFPGSLNMVSGMGSAEAELINKYRAVEQDPLVDEAIVDIVNEAIVYDDGEAPVYVDMKPSIDKSEFLKGKIVTEFNTILKLLDFQNKGWQIFRRWYVDGRLIYFKTIDKDHPEYGLIELRRIEPYHIQRVQMQDISNPHETKGITLYRGTPKISYLYSPGSPLSNSSTNFDMSRSGGYQSTLAGGATSAISLPEDTIAYITSGLLDLSMAGAAGGQPIVISYLQKAIKPANQLNMMEDSMVIYRLTRAPERRVFYVDVGRMPKYEAEAYMQEQIDKYRTKISYNPLTGGLVGKNNYMSIQEDFWLPKRADSQGWSIEPLEGGKQLSEIEDTQYFLKKLYKALRVPASRMTEEGSAFKFGNTADISRDEVKFSRFIGQLRGQFSLLFYDLLQTQLILRGVIKPDEWDEIKDKIKFVYRHDVYFAELKNAELMQRRAELYTAMKPAIDDGFYTREWVAKNIFHLTEEELLEMDTEKLKEKITGEDKMSPGESGGGDFGALPDETSFDFSTPSGPEPASEIAPEVSTDTAGAIGGLPADEVPPAPIE